MKKKLFLAFFMTFFCYSLVFGKVFLNIDAKNMVAGESLNFKEKISFEKETESIVMLSTDQKYELKFNVEKDSDHKDSKYQITYTLKDNTQNKIIKKSYVDAKIDSDVIIETANNTITPNYNLKLNLRINSNEASTLPLRRIDH